MQTEIKLEYARRKSQTSRMLEAFKLKGELTTVDLSRIGTGCSSRLHTLRKEGHVILSSFEKPGKWRYTYIGEKIDE